MGTYILEALQIYIAAYNGITMGELNPQNRTGLGSCWNTNNIILGVQQ
jgi:hypothetical protein